jgi:CheY-like chemotaxis protein
VVIGAMTGSIRTRTRRVKALAQPSEPAPRKLHILFADDHEVNREFVSQILSKRDHAVHLASDGLEALDMLHREKFDIALMDVQMPGMSGLEVTGRVRRGEAASGRHLLVVGVTAGAYARDREDCLKAGMDDYISKPFSASELVDKVESMTRSLPKETLMDRALALVNVGDDPELLKTLCKLFIEKAPEVMGELRGAFERRDSGAMARAAHMLKGSLGTLGRSAPLDVARALEIAAREGRWSGVEESFTRLEQMMTSVLKELAEWQKG